MKRIFRFGPALLVTAAFIGPGTVMTATQSGASYGYTLIWAIVFSVAATCVLQEMAARLGIVTGKGLSDAIRESLPNSFIRWSALTLVLGAILVGNAAYQTGNILGGAAGLTELIGMQIQYSAVIIGIIALVVIWIGRIEYLQYGLMALVVLMSLFFIIAAVKSQPLVQEMVTGLVPNIPEDATMIVIGLIGTTVVPYNLFLHASAAAEKWREAPNQNSAIRDSRWDTIISVGLGGCVTAAVLITAAVAFSGTEFSFNGVGDVVKQLEPALGTSAKTLFACGLMAAGLTSAITAPIAAGYATAGCFGWPIKFTDWRLKSVATVVILFGFGFAIAGSKSPRETIILAQVANGLLLPIIAFFLIVVANQSKILKKHTNGIATNALAVIVLIVTIAIASRTFISVWSKLQAYFTISG